MDTVTLRIHVAQTAPVVGAIGANTATLGEHVKAARAAGAHLCVSPELSVTGYPLGDLAARTDVVAAAAGAVAELAGRSRDLVTIVGAPRVVDSRADVDAADRHVRNTAFVVSDGEIVSFVDKQLLPDYGPFDETRVFAPGLRPAPWRSCVDIAGVRVGVLVCEDLWAPGPAEALAAGGPDLVVAVNASPWEIGKQARRERVAGERAVELGVPVLYVNCAGAVDGLVFDGASFLTDGSGAVVWRAPAFVPAGETIDVPVQVRPGRRGLADIALEPRVVTDPAKLPAVRPVVDGEQAIWSALCAGIRAYVDDNGFGSVVLGSSGGIDSAVVAALATDALGSDRVRTVAMPGPHSSPQSAVLAGELAGRLGVSFEVVDINATFDVLAATLHDGPLAGTAAFDVTEENLQARIRGMVLMAISNKTGALVLACGNRSEFAVGYSTLYGDMAGGFSPIGDVPKTMVFALARWRNTHLADGTAFVGPGPIPAGIVNRPPSAELAPGQLDAQSLPPYEVLDAIVAGYVIDDLSPDDLVGAGFDPVAVDRVVGLVDRAEFKRRQGAPYVKVTSRSLVTERRVPITNGWRPRVTVAAPIPAAGG